MHCSKICVYKVRVIVNCYHPRADVLSYGVDYPQGDFLVQANLRRCLRWPSSGRITASPLDDLGGLRFYVHVMTGLQFFLDV